MLNIIMSAILLLLFGGVQSNNNTVSPNITFRVNILPQNPAPETNLIGQNTPTSFRRMQATLTVPGVNYILYNGDVFSLSGLQALQVKSGYSSGILNDMTSQPLVVTSVS